MDEKDQITRADVRNYLRQYQRAKCRKKDLELRRASISAESMGLYNGESGKDAAAAIDYRLDQLNQRIAGQQADAADAILQVMEVIDYLPENSPERDIIELRYIDGLTWGCIERRLYTSRSRATSLEKQGIERLMAYPRVRKLAAKYRSN